MTYQTLIEFVLLFQEATTNRQEKFLLGNLEEKEVEILLDLTQIDVTGFQRIVDNFGVRHAFKKHGHTDTEAPRGQIAIAALDFELIISTAIISENTSVEVGKKGLFIVRSEIEGKDFLLIYAEEIRIRQRELAFQTLYKKKSASLGDSRI